MWITSARQPRETNKPGSRSLAGGILLACHFNQWISGAFRPGEAGQAFG